ncbi:MAG: OmpA family protein [Pseudomonadales bacterium]|nr:OmpA family protein [Pseudomonadales bacterium]
MKLFKFSHKLVLLGAMILPWQSLAADEGQFYIAPGLQWLDFNSSIRDTNDTSFNLGIGYGITDNWSTEINYGQFNLNTSSLNEDLDHYRLDFIYDFNWRSRNGLLTPFLVTGLGHNEFKDDQETLAGIGLGLKYKLSERFEWRTGFRVFHGFDDSTSDTSFETALVFNFGKPASRSRVEASAAPASTPASTSTPTAVAAIVDSDGDGVPDGQDACPDTPRNHQVDARGCSIMLEEVERIELDVQFDFDRSEVKQEYLAEIRRVADFLRTYTDTVANLEGHTDSVGSEEYNRDLSQRRVSAVRQVLVQQFGIEPGRITVTGYGESRPRDTNDTPAGRARNRRVEGVITATLQRPQTR